MSRAKSLRETILDSDSAAILCAFAAGLKAGIALEVETLDDDLLAEEWAQFLACLDDAARWEET